MSGASEKPQALKGRFAPSPTGRMHAGNVYASLCAWLIAKSSGGSMVLRIEDLDEQRSKACFIDALQHDLDQLGLTWDEGPYFQHNRSEVYEQAFAALEARGLTYPCFCSRADLLSSSAPHFGEKTVYAQTCRHLTSEEVARLRTEKSPAFRLRVPAEGIRFSDSAQGGYTQQLDTECGDFIIKRSDGAFAYQLAVVVDDAAQGVSSVVRGIDLLCSTPQQILLQHLLGYSTPSYAHIPLFVAEENKRLSKRNHDASLEWLLRQYKTPEGVIGHIAYIGALSEVDEPRSPSDLLKSFNAKEFYQRIHGLIQIQWR